MHKGFGLFKCLAVCSSVCTAAVIAQTAQAEVSISPNEIRKGTAIEVVRPHAGLDIQAIIKHEVDQRQSAREQYMALGQADACNVLKFEVDLLTRYLTGVNG